MSYMILMFIIVADLGCCAVTIKLTQTGDIDRDSIAEAFEARSVFNRHLQFKNCSVHTTYCKTNQAVLVSYETLRFRKHSFVNLNAN